MSVRAVLYARCSTEEEAQKDALLQQVAEGEACIREMGWTYTDSYVESRSGTSTKGRVEYNRLYEDLTWDTFEVIVIKSQDRLMRNVMDWYLFVNRLLQNGKKLYMYLERKFYTPDDALITGIKAILAEEYSRELSKKINNAHQNRQKNGGTVILTSNTYGYRKLPDKSIAVVEEEAAVKRRMYELCAAGYGGRAIEAILKQEGIVNRKGKPFTNANIIRMIKNPLHKGTAVMGKTHYDFDSKQTVKRPKEQQYRYEHKVPAIVSEELWERANQAIRDRTRRKRAASKEKTATPSAVGRYVFSGKLICGLCGSPYYRTVRHRKDGTKLAEWKCSRYLSSGRKEKEGCGNIHLEEERLFLLFSRVFFEDSGYKKEEMIEKFSVILEQELQCQDAGQEIRREQERMEAVREQMRVLLDKLMAGIVPDDLYQMKQKELQERAEIIEERIALLQQKDTGNRKTQERIAQIRKILYGTMLFEQAVTAGLLEQIRSVIVCPSYMELWPGSAQASQKEPVRVEFGSYFDYLQQKKELRDRIAAIRKERPEMTEKELAREMGITPSQVQYALRRRKMEESLGAEILAKERN